MCFWGRTTECDTSVDPSLWDRATYEDEDDDGHKIDVPRNKHIWETTIPIYTLGPDVPWTEHDQCSNPGGPLTIVGFTRFTMTDVGAPPLDKYVTGRVECGRVDNENTRGGGGTGFGVVGDIPNIVQ